MTMSGRKLLFSLSLVLILLSAYVPSANATTTPEFPACANPQGTVKVTYDSGTHGVAGDGATYTGKDTVYTISENTQTQCLCTVNSQGIQTNWWKVSSLTQDEINVLISQGWILIPNGALWGLDSAPYLAKNSSYTCTGSGGTSESKSAGASATQGVTQTILALASTGNTLFILGVFLTGLTLLGVGAVSSIKKRG